MSLGIIGRFPFSVKFTPTPALQPGCSFRHLTEFWIGDMLSQFEEAFVRERTTRFGVPGPLTGLDVATLPQNGRLIWETYSVIPEISLSRVSQRLACAISAPIPWRHVNLDLRSVVQKWNLSSPPDPSRLWEIADV